MKKRFIMKKQAQKQPSPSPVAPADSSLSVELDSSVDVETSSSLGGRDEMTTSAPSTSRKQAGSATRFASSMQKTKSKLLRPKQQTTPKKRASDSKSTEKKKRRTGDGDGSESKSMIETARKPSLAALSHGSSLFSLLLLVSLFPLLPVGSQDEIETHFRLRSLALNSTQLLADMLGQMSQLLANPRETVLNFCVQVEMIRRLSLVSLAPLVDLSCLTQANFVPTYSGAHWIQFILQSASSGYDAAWKTVMATSSAGVQDLVKQDRSCLLALGMSHELESARWLALLYLMRDVVDARLSASVSNQVVDITTDRNVAVSEACRAFSLSELQAVASALNQTSAMLVMNFTTTPIDELEKHFSRYSHLFKIVRACILNEASVFDNPDKHRDLPYPFLIFLASYHAADPQRFLAPMPPSLLPPPLLFHARPNPQTDPVIAGSLGVISSAMKELSRLVQSSAEAMAASPIDLDVIRSLAAAIEAIEFPAGFEELQTALRDLKQLVTQGTALEAFGFSIQKEWKSLRAFAKIFSPGNPAEAEKLFQQQLDGPNSWPRSLASCLSGKFTSEKLRGFPKIVTDVEEWRRNYAKLRAMLAPASASERSSVPNKRRGKLRLTAGGAVKVSGETGFLRPSQPSGGDGNNMCEPTDSGRRLTFGNQVPIAQAAALLDAGRALGVQLPELEELNDWVEMCGRYEMKLRDSAQFFVDSVLLTVYSSNNETFGSRFQSATPEELSARLMDYRRPCLCCVALLVATPLELHSDYACLPFAIENADQSIVTKCLEALKAFLTALKRFTRQTYVAADRETLTLDFEKELLEYNYGSVEQEIQEWRRRKNKVAPSPPQNLQPPLEFGLWVAQAADVFEVLQAKLTDCVMIESPSTRETPALTTEQIHELEVGEALEEARDLQCAACREKLESEFQTRPLFRRCFLLLLPFLKILVRIYDQVIMQQFALNTIAVHIVSKVSGDRRFHPGHAAGLLPLTQERAMVSAFRSLCSEVHEIHKHGSGSRAWSSAPATISYLLQLEQLVSDPTTELSPLALWRATAVSLLTRLRTAVLAVLQTTSDGALMPTCQWKAALGSGLHFLTAETLGLPSPPESFLKEAGRLESLFQGDSTLQLRVPWKVGVIKGLLLRSLSLLGLFQHYSSSTEEESEASQSSDDSIVTMHCGLTRLLKSIQETDIETSFDRSIYTIVRQATWERRAREALRVTQVSIEKQNFSLQSLVSIVAEITAVDGLCESARLLFDDASRLLRQALMRASAVATLISWLRGTPLRSDLLQSDALFARLMTQELKQQLFSSPAAVKCVSEEQVDQLLAEFVSEAQPLFADKVVTVQAAKQAPQTALLWRICRGTSRLLLTPPASAAFFEVSIDTIHTWLRHATTWNPARNAEAGVWAVLAGGSIPGQVVAIDTMRLASAGLSTRAFAQCVISDVTRLASGNPSAAFAPLGVARNAPPQDSPLHYFMGAFLPVTSDSERDLWSVALGNVPWPSVVFASCLKGVATYEAEETWDMPSARTSISPSDEFLQQVAAELAAFLEVCEARLRLLQGLTDLTVPRISATDLSPSLSISGSFVVSSVSDASLSAGSTDEEDEPSKLRAILALAARHAEWLQSCAICLGPKMRDGELINSRETESLIETKNAFIQLKQSVLRRLGDPSVSEALKGLLCGLLFGDLASEWESRRAGQQLTDASVDLFLGGLLGLELKRSIASISTLAEAASEPISFKHQLSRVASLLEVFTATSLSETVTNWSLAASLSLQTTLPAFTEESSHLVPLLPPASTKFVFLPENTPVLIPDLPEFALPHREVFWLEQILANVVGGILLDEGSVNRPSAANPETDFASSVYKQVQALLTDNDSGEDAKSVTRPIRVLGGKLLWSLVVEDDITSFCVCVEVLRAGEKILQFKFVSPLLLIALLECAPVNSLLSTVSGLSEQMRDFFRNVVASNLKLPKALSLISRFLAIRLSIASELKMPAVFYNLASDVLRRVDAVSQRYFPTDLVDVSRQLFNLGSMSLELNEIWTTIRNICPAPLLSKIQQGNSMLVTHPPKLCFLELTAFQQAKPLFQPLIDRVEAVLAGTERSTLFMLLQVSQSIDHAVLQTRVSHPCWEQFKLFLEDSLSVMRAYQDLAQTWQAAAAALVTSGRSIFEQYWNAQQATLALLSVRRVPSPHSTDLLLHCFGWHNLGQLAAPNRPTLAALQARRNAPSLAALRDENAPVAILSVMEQLTDNLSAWERQCSQALRDTSTQLISGSATNDPLSASGGDNNSASRKLPLSILVRLFLFPRLPPELQQWLMPSNAPDLSHLLGVPTPFGLFEAVASPDLEVSKAISGWTMFALHETLKAIECHEILFGGPDAPVASSEALKLGVTVDSNTCGPQWAAAADASLQRMLLLLPLCCDLGPYTPTNRLLYIMQIRSLQLLKQPGDSNTDRLKAILQVLSHFPQAVDAVHCFLAQTGVARILFRCLWELIVNFLPCRGDPFNMSHTQPIFKERHTNSLIFSPSSATTHKLFAIGKACLREPIGVPTEGEHGYLENVPPSLHPELKAYFTRTHLTNQLPNYTPWAKRAEKLCEALKSALQYGKILIGEARASVETFASRLSLYGLCPVLSLTEDLRSFKHKIEVRSGVKIEAGEAFVARPDDASDSDSKTDPDPLYVTEAELHRLNWLSTAVGPSVVLAQVTKKSAAVVATTASPTLVQWIEGNYFPETRDLLVARCKEAPPLTETASQVFDLIIKFACLASDGIHSEEIDDDIDVVNIAVHEAPRRLSKKRFSKIAVSNDEALLALIAAHLLVSPFDLSLLRHPTLLTQQHPAFEHKVIYAPMLVISKFLAFANPQVPESDDPLRQPSDALNRQLVSCLSSHVFNRCASPEPTAAASSGSLFSAQELLQQGDVSRRPNTLSVPPVNCLARLLPELQSYSVFMDFSQKKQMLDRRISNEVAWWGSLVAPGSDFTSSYATHVMIKSAADLDSQSIQSLLSLISSFNKFDDRGVLEELLVPLNADPPEATDAGTPPRAEISSGSQTTREGSPNSTESDSESVALRQRHRLRNGSNLTAQHQQTPSSVSSLVLDSGLEEGEARDDSPDETHCGDRIRCDTLHHFVSCAVVSEDFSDICPACRRFFFSPNPNVDSKWSKVKILSDFTKCRPLLPSAIESLKLMLNVVMPLRIPVVVLPEYPENLLRDIFPPLTVFNCKKEKQNCSLSKSKLPSSILQIAPRVLRFDGLLTEAAQALLPTLRIQLFMTLSSVALHSSCLNTKACKKPFQLQNTRQLAFFGTLMIYDEKHSLGTSLSPEDHLAPPPTLRATIQNEPSNDFFIIKDSNRAVLAFSNIISNLNDSLKEIQAKEPLLVTRHNSESPIYDLPNFDKIFSRPPVASIVGHSCEELRRSGLGVTCVYCTIHKAGIVLAVDPAGRALFARASRLTKLESPN
eukprot:Gregarina_sp_Poly_1__1404@NODE_134_length_13191_cov_35_340369_g82_i1_p1_GENE_NODE_134_length_13191_cov_35_340369_g82_i1NODE_134_length_13191_cov_35_340369_g82_i1_p1_ORF_typecomplete_len3422_score568_93PLU1/PF08429_11/0_11PLU1/PF08429_11/2_6PLU1/PF08429_11/1_4e03PLU1/PF08429_11/1_2e03DUF3475/PF11961_8/2_3DUF3475/PF11961_8/1_3e03DUF3179/PF11376_8/0_37_NODE_134_length_13191_cov_35_340369_g82_i1268512950